MELEKQNILIQTNSQSWKYVIICITRKYIPRTLDPLHSYETANQVAGEHLLIKHYEFQTIRIWTCFLIIQWGLFSTFRQKGSNKQAAFL